MKQSAALGRWIVIISLIAGASLSAGVDPSPRNEPIRGNTPSYREQNLGNGAVKAALVGDSLGVPFTIPTSPLALFGSVHSLENRRGGWFYDPKPDNGLISVFEELGGERQIPAAAMNLAIASAWIEEPNFRCLAKALRIDSMDRQVSRILGEERLPNLILVWQGHNDADWKYAVDGRKLLPEQWEAHRAAMPEQLGKSLRTQLERLTKKAKTVDYPVSIVVLGLLNAQNAFDLRRVILDKRADKKNAALKLYPQLDDAISAFPSIQPQFETETVALHRAIGANWQDMVADLDKKTQQAEGNSVQVIYSDVLSNIQLTEASLSSGDGMHLSVPKGHRDIAAAVTRELVDRQVLHFIRARK